jgi:protease stability complex PrcB-like protein
MRIIRNRHFGCIGIISVSLLLGCWLTPQPKSADNQSKPAELLQSGVYGINMLQEPSATWITDHADLLELYKNLNKRHGGDDGNPPEMDFNIYGVLFLEMGQKSTGGYAFSFNPSHSHVVASQTVIQVEWNVPLEGTIVTQVLTSPYILLKVKKTEINSILVLDQNGRPLFEIPIKL